MAAMSAPERAQFLSRVLGYERIRAAQDRLKERRSALRARYDALRAGIGDLGEIEAAEARARERIAAAAKAEKAAASAAAAAERRLAELRPRWERLQQLRETALTLEAELRVADHQVVAAAERVERLEHQAAEASAAARQLEDVRRRLAALPGLRQEVEAFTARKGVLAQLDDVRRHLASVDEGMARLPASARLEEGRDRVSDLRASLTGVTLDGETLRTAWVRDAQDARTKRQGLLDQYQELKDQRQRIVNAGPEGDCPTCARPLGDEYAKVLGLLDRQIEDVVSNGNYFKQRIEQLQLEPKELDEADRRRIELERELAGAIAEVGRLEALAHEGGALTQERDRLHARVRELEAELARVPGTYEQVRHEALVAELRALEPLALQAERLRVVAEQGDAMAADLAEARQERAETTSLAADLRARLEGLGFAELAYREARDAEASAERDRREAELTLVRARGDSAAAVEAAETASQRRAERAERVREAEATGMDLALHQELDRALTELRSELNATLRPDLSELASGFLRDLTNGRYTDLELDEDYGARLLDDGDPKAVISGGEEDVANLALRLAISQMIAERAGQPLSLLILDEIFGSLDEDRRIAVVDLLRSLADRFPQVILITHVDSVREGFDRVIRVGFDVARGVATVKDEPVGDHDVAA
jgi:exonuclease SbcC